MWKLILLLVLQFNYGVHCRKKTTKNKTYPISTKFDNPNFIRDRFKIISKPELPQKFKEQFSQQYTHAWMDYCDPYHCNDYHKIACGLNRGKMKIRWFQSLCHLQLNNMCASFRGVLKYDPVETKYCSMYVMFLRSGCPTCVSEDINPVCGRSTFDSHVVLFVHECALNAVNCRSDSLQEYEMIPMETCEKYLL